MDNKFKELNSINVSKHIEKKGRFNYLSWTYAVQTLLENDPGAWWAFDQPLFLHDQTVLIFCKLHAFEKVIHMQLPVLNHQNKPISNPNAFDVNTSMMRCLAKAIACTGIGLYIYAGEDLPISEEPPPPIHMEKGADDVPPDVWLNSTIERMYAYIETPKADINKFVKSCGDKRLDPIFEKLNEEQKETFEIAAHDAGKKLEAKLKEKK